MSSPQLHNDYFCHHHMKVTSQVINHNIWTFFYIKKLYFYTFIYFLLCLLMSQCTLRQQQDVKGEILIYYSMRLRGKELKKYWHNNWSFVFALRTWISRYWQREFFCCYILFKNLQKTHFFYFVHRDVWLREFFSIFKAKILNLIDILGLMILLLKKKA